MPARLQVAGEAHEQHFLLRGQSVEDAGKLLAAIVAVLIILAIADICLFIVKLGVVITMRAVAAAAHMPTAIVQ